MNDKAKRQAISEMSTAAIKHTLDTLSETERQEVATMERPLAGLVFYEGIGQVKVAWLRQELTRRGGYASREGKVPGRGYVIREGKPVDVYTGEELEL